MNPSPINFQSQAFWGLLFQVQVLKVGVSKVGYEHFAPQEEAPSLCFLPIVGHYARSRVYEVIASHHLLPTLMWLFCLLDVKELLS